MALAREVIDAVAGYDLTFIPTFLIFTSLEAVIPRASSPDGVWDRLKARAPITARAAAFWLVWAPFTVGIGLTYQRLIPFHAQALFPVLESPALPRPLRTVLGALAAAVVGDFFYYWCHRAQHRFFWRFHAVHHSVRAMSGVAAYHHVTEEAFKLALYALPLSFVTTDPFAIPVLGGLLGLHGNYLHSPIRLNYGPLALLLQDNRYHRIHHSSEPRHHDKNFGVFCTIWDVLFGTAYFPAKDEWPMTGVASAPEPENLDDFFLLPFRMTHPVAVTCADNRGRLLPNETEQP